MNKSSITGTPDNFLGLSLPRVIAISFIFGLTLLLYLQTITFDFVLLDDPKYVKDNPMVQDGLSLKGIHWALTASYASNWHPLTWMSHMLDVSLYGMSPGLHHLTNLIIHVTNAILLFLVFLRMTNAFWSSALIAAIFALHPLRVESVAWIAERKDVLFFFFWMLTMWGYLRYTETKTRHWYLAVILFFLMGLMAKPMIVSLPLILFLIDFWPLNRFRLSLSPTASPGIDPVQDKRFWFHWKSIQVAFLEKIPLLILSAASGLWTFYVQREAGAVSSLHDITFVDRLNNPLIAYLRYLADMVWPSSLAAFYPYIYHPFWLALIAAVILGAISYIAVRQMRCRPYVTIGWFWYIITFIPVIGIVQVGLQSKADRYTYLPHIGLSIIIVYGLKELFHRRAFKRVLFVSLGIASLSVLAFLTVYQIRVWQNSITLFEHGLSVKSGYAADQIKMAHPLYIPPKPSRAISHYHHALRLKPQLSEAHVKLGNCYVSNGSPDKALFHFQQAIEIDPENKDALNAVGMIYMDHKKYDLALTYIDKVLVTNSDDPKALHQKGLIYSYLNDTQEAIKILKMAAAVTSDPQVFTNLAQLLLQTGQIEESRHYRTLAKQISDSMPPGYNTLDILLKHSWAVNRLTELESRLTSRTSDYRLYIKIGDKLLEKEALEKMLRDFHSILYKRSCYENQRQGRLDIAQKHSNLAVAIDPEDFEALRQSAIVYAQTGQYNHAIAFLNKGTKIQPQNPESYYLIASMYAKKKQAEKALHALQQAVDRGFDDWQRLRHDPNLNYIKKTPYVSELVKTN